MKLMFAVTLAAVLAVSAAGDWLTVVLTKLDLNPNCVERWVADRSCANPNIKLIISNELPRHVIVSWPISEQLFKTERRHFTSHWQSPIDYIHIITQVEGDVMFPVDGKPFHVPCDQTTSQLVLRPNNDVIAPVTNGSDWGEKTSLVLPVKSTCFDATLLVKRGPIGASRNASRADRLAFNNTAMNTSSVDSLVRRLSAYDLRFVAMTLGVIAVVCLIILLTTIDLSCRARQLGSFARGIDVDLETELDRNSDADETCGRPAKMGRCGRKRRYSQTSSPMCQRQGHVVEASPQTSSGIGSSIVTHVNDSLSGSDGEGTISLTIYTSDDCLADVDDLELFADDVMRTPIYRKKLVKTFPPKRYRCEKFYRDLQTHIHDNPSVVDGFE